MEKKKIAYILSVFPGYTETFVSNEIREIRKKMAVYIFSLKNLSKEIIHKDCVDLKKETFYSPYLLSLNLIKAQLYFIFRDPHRYLSCLLKVIFENIRDPITVIKTLFIFPKIIYFARIIHHLGIQHIHAHWASIPSTGAYIVGNLLDIPYSFTAHAYDIYVRPSMIRRKLQSARFIITISEYNKKWLVDRYGTEYKDKICVIHCGIDVMKFYPNKHEKDNLFTILTVARFVRKKGLKYLIRACRILNERGLPFKCIIVGDGPERRRLEQLIREYRISEKVRLITPLTQEKIVELLTKAHAFILPCGVGNKNDVDGIPVSLMEAMAMRLPVVSTGISGIPELIENNFSGLLVSPGSEVEIANAVVRLMNNSNSIRLNLGLKGREKVVRDFNIENTSAQLINLLKGGVI